MSADVEFTIPRRHASWVLFEVKAFGGKFSCGLALTMCNCAYTASYKRLRMDISIDNPCVNVVFDIYVFIDFVLCTFLGIGFVDQRYVAHTDNG